MRDVVAKNVTEEDILESAHRVFGRGFSRMKLYFMIGLPTETGRGRRSASSRPRRACRRSGGATSAARR